MRHKDKNTTKPYIFVSLSTQLFVNLEVFTSLKKQHQNVEQRNMPETIYLWFWLHQKLSVNFKSLEKKKTDFIFLVHGFTERPTKLTACHCEPLSFYYTGENCRTMQPLVRNNALHTISDICES